MFKGLIIILGKKICRIYQYRNSQYRNDENVAVLTHLVTVLTYAVKKVQFWMQRYQFLVKFIKWIYDKNALSNLNRSIKHKLNDELV